MGKTKIILHPGPHKTGTTSVQQVLSRLYGGDTVGKIWYPAPKQFGPGHAEIAWSVLGVNGYQRNPFILRDILERGRSKGADIIIISAEDFCRARTEDMYAIKEQFREQELILIFTLNTIRNRSGSLWQELVKHSHDRSIFDSRDSVLSHPSMNPYLIENFINTIEPEDAYLVTSNRYDGKNKLIDGFFTAVKDVVGNEKFGEARSMCVEYPKANTSLGTREILILSEFNRLYKQYDTKRYTYKYFRDIILRAFRSKRWKDHVEFLPLKVPSQWNDELEKLEEKTIASIRQLNVEGRLKIYGSDADLLAKSECFESRDDEADEKEAVEDLTHPSSVENDRALYFYHLLMALIQDGNIESHNSKGGRNKQSVLSGANEQPRQPVASSAEYEELKGALAAEHARVKELEHALTAEQRKFLPRPLRKAVSINGVRRLMGL